MCKTPFSSILVFNWDWKWMHVEIEGTKFFPSISTTATPIKLNPTRRKKEKKNTFRDRILKYKTHTTISLSLALSVEWRKCWCAVISVSDALKFSRFLPFPLLLHGCQIESMLRREKKLFGDQLDQQDFSCKVFLFVTYFFGIRVDNHA